MNILYFMDPFVDFDEKFDDRSFVAKNDLNAFSLARNLGSNKDISVSFAAISTILNKNGMGEEFRKAGIKLISFDKTVIKGLFGHNNTSELAVQLGNVSSDCAKSIQNYLRNQLKGVKPDVIIYWENVCDYIKEIFPNAIFIEGSHTGFYFLEGNADILYTVFKGKKELTKFNKESIEGLHLESREEEEIELFKSFFKAHIVPDSQITRENLDPISRFKHFVVYPGNFPSSKFKRSGFSSNHSVLSLLLDSLPDDCAILYSPHRLDKLSGHSAKLDNERIIDLSKYSKFDKNITLKAIAISDAVVNVYSNIFMPSMALEKPVFGIGKANNAKFSLGNLEDLVSWLKSDKVVPPEYRKFEQKTLFYVLTRKINTSFVTTTRGSLLYLKELLNRIENKKYQFDCLPVLSTVRGYLNQFRQNILFKNSYFDSYKPTTHDVLLSHLLNPKIKAIGFDVFDTLLCRPLIKPIDLFDLMEEEAENIIGKKGISFSKTRVAAERIARYGKVEITFDDIYNILQQRLRLTTDQRIKLQQLEVSFESKFLKPRETALNLFRLAKQEGKRVFIASDMYLSKQIISQFLEKNGYCLDGVDIFISSEIGAVKSDGSLFRVISQNFGIAPTETVFIGDNYRSDVVQASEQGFIGTHFPKAIEVFSTNPLFDGNVMKFLKDSSFGFHWGYLANRLFDNPYIKFDKREVVNNSPALLGYLIFGPIVLSLTEWLIKESRTGNYDSILFSSRDSRVVIDIYNYWKKRIDQSIPQAHYIHISRTATLPAYCDSEHILSLLSMHASQLSTKDYLRKVFCIDVSEKTIKKKLNHYKIDIDQDSRVNLNRLSMFLLDYFENNKEIQEKIDCIRGYFAPLIQNKKVACFDLGTRGTSRDILEDMFDTEIDLFLFRTTRYKCRNNLEAYTNTTLNPYRHGRISLPSQCYELLLSDPLVNTCQGYERIGNVVRPIVESSEFTESSLLVIEVQRYIRDFCYEFIELFGPYADCINSQCRTVFIYPISFLCANTTDKKLMSRFKGDDPFWTKGDFSIVASEIKKKTTAITPPVKGKARQPIIQNSGLQAKLARSPEEYFRDSRLPLLKAVYRIRNVPLLGKVLMSIATKATRTIILTRK